ncbi:dienelactone hydrolase family protein [Paucibacter sp. PLA-PC-4]|uniref:dienelactone hydrolase family protein n=1 Tax=Paucibacter sp. PLA-PC-4 TaxID=2993655 RepID=UPI00224877CD|nr:dienelactone hydrolase family protein [Paucibacter sp. PLA-PC-4]MCX2861525.1 dienelactone hydrolase family protein [Paucibacter sp. PLA-PC-4]
MGQMIDFQRPDGGTSSAWLAEAGTGRPGLILIQEWWGLNPHIRELAERFAAAGYTTLAPDLYRGRIAADADEANHLMSGLDFADATHQDLAGALGFLQARCPRIGVLGFCMGGALTIAAAVHLPGLAAACCFYGIPPAEFADPAKIAIPLQGHFAERDDWCTPATVDGLVAALKAPAEIHRYPADHAFFNDQRPEVFDAASAQLAWRRTLDFLGRTLSLQ